MPGTFPGSTALLAACALESKRGSKKLAFFALESERLQRTTHPSDVSATLYAPLHSVARSLVGASTLSLHPAFAKKRRPQIDLRRPL